MTDRALLVWAFDLIQRCKAAAEQNRPIPTFWFQSLCGATLALQRDMPGAAGILAACRSAWNSFPAHVRDELLRVPVSAGALSQAEIPDVFDPEENSP